MRYTQIAEGRISSELVRLQASVIPVSLVHGQHSWNRPTSRMGTAAEAHLPSPSRYVYKLASDSPRLLVH